MKKGMNLQLDDEARERLEALAERSGKTKTAVIRSLIMGRAMPNRERRLVLARLSQLGAVLRHCAVELMEKGDGMEDFARAGSEIREIALRLAMGSRDEADDHLQAD